MEPKKDLKVNLELRKTTLVLVGLVAALAVLFITLEWSDSQTRKSNVMVRVANDEPEEVMIVTMQNLQTPPPPPPPAPDVIEQLEVVDDNVIIDEVDMLSMEDDDDVEVKIVNLDAAPSEGEEEADLNQTFVLVEEQPEFPGGESALMQYLRDHLRYPAFAQENGIQGRVVLSFIVERDGSIANIEAMRSPAEELTKESIRVVQSMPKWKPGKQRGKAVRVKYVLPVVFHLS
ncbi:MAG: TonB family protein [Bacteroidales bacterium]|nr:TonB family protein [Bacteroidales bacterium]